jgi:hypothetical protein
MTVDRVTYQEILPTGNYLNHKPGLEASVGPGEDPVEALLKLKALADEFHKMAYPDLQINNVPDSENSSHKENSEPAPKEIRIGVMAKDIRSCSDIKILETYRFIKDTDPELQKAYHETKNKLENANNS